MKFNVFVAIAALAYGSSLVLAAPVDFDTQALAAREVSYEVEDFVARDVADVDEFDAREYLDEELEAREDELEDVFERSVSILIICEITYEKAQKMFVIDSLAVEAVADEVEGVEGVVVVADVGDSGWVVEVEVEVKPLHRSRSSCIIRTPFQNNSFQRP